MTRSGDRLLLTSAEGRTERSVHISKGTWGSIGCELRQHHETGDLLWSRVRHGWLVAVRRGWGMGRVLCSQGTPAEPPGDSFECAADD